LDRRFTTRFQEYPMALETGSAVGTSCLGQVVAVVGVGDVDVAAGSGYEIATPINDVLVPLLSVGYAWPFLATDSAS
jgi:hypothetical protein